MQMAPGAQSAASRQPSTGGRREKADDDEDTSTTGTREETAELERVPPHTMHGKSGVTVQDLPCAAQKRSPPSAHSLPRQAPPTGITDDLELARTPADDRCVHTPSSHSPLGHCQSAVQPRADEADSLDRDALESADERPAEPREER